MTTTTPVRVNTARTTVPAPVPTYVSTPVATLSTSAKVTTFDIMTVLAPLDQKLGIVRHEITRLTADNVAIRHDLVVCTCNFTF
jgi:hypothetical protein